MGNYDVIMKRTENFRKDRFGLFIHYGLYSIRGRNEWCKTLDKLSEEQYQVYFDNFTAEHYDPVKWAKLAKKAGMKYAVLTTKHHEGFCLFDSKYTDYKATNTKAGRDLVKEFVDAFRAEGIKIGLYYSLIDWHHFDYPHAGHQNHPRRNDPGITDEGRDFSRYIEYMHNQVRELCTNYGKIDIMWFDFSYNEMQGEMWQATKLVNMVRELQPGVIIDNRLMVGRSAFENLDEAPVYCGDFTSPELYIPTKGVTDKLGRPVPWEACMTTQMGSWCYMDGNENFMSPRQAIYTLVNCVSKNGNLLLNVGPTAKGDFPKQTVELLEGIGEWMYQNSESIYNCYGCPDYPQPEWGRLTTDGKHVYAHFFDIAGYYAAVRGLPVEKVKYAVNLEDGTEVTLGAANGPSALQDHLDGNVLIAFKKARLKNPLDTVVKIFLKEGETI